ncbi:MAG: hypothetical protein FJY74_06470 [Candidatus Eisenbacteria bacterium]|nr:hypothetical protein [Candidatus Eisenbacteria bacterium]
MGVCACVLLAFLLCAGTAWSADAPVTDAARPAGLAQSSAPLIRMTPGAQPDSGTLSDELSWLLGSEAYPGAPTAADLGFTGPRCELDCGACDRTELEPICEDDWEDIWNGGCNSSPEVFQTLAPYYGRITVCGTSGTYLYGSLNYRDTDWYEIELLETTTVRFGCTAEFPVLIFFINGTAGCGALEVVDMATADACDEAWVEATVGPGTYWLWVGSQTFDGVPCGSEYLMTVDGFYADSCVADCPFGSVVEGEPMCHVDYVDSWNGGCNSMPYVFQTLDPSAGTIRVCGETGVFENGGQCWRDTDWYQITLDQPRTIEMCAFGEMPLLLFILGGSCDGLTFLDTAFVDACDAGCVSAALSPGTYWLWVGPQFWLPTDCGSKYTMTVTGYTTPVERRSWGTVKTLYR